MKSHINVNAILFCRFYCISKQILLLEIQKIKFNNKRARRHGHFTVFFTFSKKKKKIGKFLNV